MQCAYSSDLNVSRFTAPKSEYEQLKSSYGNMSTLYERLKHGSATAVSELQEQIRLENEIPGLLEDRSIFHWSVNYSQLEEYNIGPVDKREKPLMNPAASTAAQSRSLLNLACSMNRGGEKA
jgi:hypothetical protein